MNFLKFFPQNILSRLDISKEVHLAVINTIINILSVAEEDTELLILELCITTATGMWLNEWGSWFGVTRVIDETDDVYRTRIISSIQNPKVTVPALKSNVASYLSKKYNVTLADDDISIFEPFTQLKAFSKKGTFSGNCRYPDGTYWRGNTIDIIIPEDADSTLISLVNNIKAAGIKVYFTQTQNSGIIVDDADTLVDNNYPETLVEYDCFVPRRVQGNIFGSNVATTSRFRSGKQNMYCEIIIILETDVLPDRIASESYVYNLLKDIKQNNHKNKYGNNVLSTDYWFYDSITIVENDDPIDIQLPMNYFHVGYRPKRLSDVFSKFSGSGPLSGIENGGYNGVKPDFTVDAFIQDTEVVILSDVVAIHDVKHTPSADTRSFSGIKNIWWDSYVENDTSYVSNQNVSPGSIILTLDDIEYASVYDIDNVELIEAQPDAEIEIVNIIPDELGTVSTLYTQLSDGTMEPINFKKE